MGREGIGRDRTGAARLAPVIGHGGWCFWGKRIGPERIGLERSGSDWSGPDRSGVEGLGMEWLHQSSDTVAGAL